MAPAPPEQPSLPHLGPSEARALHAASRRCSAGARGAWSRAAGGGPVRIYGAVACHAQSADRAVRLRQCLASAAASTRLAGLAVSWSADGGEAVGEAVRTELEASAAAAEAKGIWFRALAQEGQLAQFEHLARCTEALASDAGAWEADAFVCFGDDDDLWHPGRCAAYAEAVARARAQGVRELQAAVAPARARPSRGGRRRMCSAEDVSEALAETSLLEANSADGAAEEASAEEAGKASAARLERRLPPQEEWWQWVVRLDALRAFFARAPPRLLAHRYCDTRFARYCQFEAKQWRPGEAKRFGAAPEPLVVEGGEGNWMYYYDRWQDGPTGLSEGSGRASMGEIAPGVQEDELLEPHKAQIQPEDLSAVRKRLALLRDAAECYVLSMKGVGWRWGSKIGPPARLGAEVHAFSAIEEAVHAEEAAFWRARASEVVARAFEAYA